MVCSCQVNVVQAAMSVQWAAARVSQQLSCVTGYGSVLMALMKIGALSVPRRPLPVRHILQCHKSVWPKTVLIS